MGNRKWQPQGCEGAAGVLGLDGSDPSVVSAQGVFLGSWSIGLLVDSILRKRVSKDTHFELSWKRLAPSLTQLLTKITIYLFLDTSYKYKSELTGVLCYDDINGVYLLSVIETWRGMSDGRCPLTPIPEFRGSKPDTRRQALKIDTCHRSSTFAWQLASNCCMPICLFSRQHPIAGHLSTSDLILAPKAFHL